MLKLALWQRLCNIVKSLIMAICRLVCITDLYVWKSEFLDNVNSPISNFIKICETVYKIYRRVYSWPCGNQALLWSNMTETRKFTTFNEGLRVEFEESLSSGLGDIRSHTFGHSWPPRTELFCLWRTWGSHSCDYIAFVFHVNNA
jgi:hypothetical protein